MTGRQDYRKVFTPLASLNRVYPACPACPVKFEDYLTGVGQSDRTGVKRVACLTGACPACPACPVKFEDYLTGVGQSDRTGVEFPPLGGTPYGPPWCDVQGVLEIEQEVFPELNIKHPIYNAKSGPGVWARG